MVVTLVEMKAVLARLRRVQVLQPVPVDATDRGFRHLEEGVDLACFVIAPGGVSALRDPDLRLQAVVVENGASLVDESYPSRPSCPRGIPRSRKSMEADHVHLMQNAALRHSGEPVRVEGAHAAKDGAPSATTDPMAGHDHHIREDSPVRVEPPVPIVEVVRLVPELDMREMTAIAGEHHVEEIGICLGITG